jgi:hypothetical protein
VAFFGLEKQPSAASPSPWCRNGTAFALFASVPRQQDFLETRLMAPQLESRAGKVKYALLGWLIGLPLPIVILLLFFRGCDF